MSDGVEPGRRRHVLVDLERGGPIERRDVAPAAQVGAQQRGQHRNVRKVHDAVAAGVGLAGVPAEDQLGQVLEQLGLAALVAERRLDVGERPRRWPACGGCRRACSPRPARTAATSVIGVRDVRRRRRPGSRRWGARTASGRRPVVAPVGGRRRRRVDDDHRFDEGDVGAVGLERADRPVEGGQRAAAPLGPLVREDEQEVAVQPLADLGRLLVADRRQAGCCRRWRSTARAARAAGDSRSGPSSSGGRTADRSRRRLLGGEADAAVLHEGGRRAPSSAGRSSAPGC